ncbi:hypothetical protein [Patiriisocius hiemis]|uniref:Uncharacterized protein n=1 Tax=Patiriisocius hiemis TaxID=3075604 RepID=A0ABU2YA58_9FLAO|nr:hypothetical protein [Constantimarinum sp. W242]MDT0554907.1 hypothetical protein [Constantimarinum sp. W242]
MRLSKYIFLFTTLLLFISCDKEDDRIPSTNNAIFVELRNFETGEYFLGTIDANQAIEFRETPNNAQESNLEVKEDRKIFYTYKPNDGFDGRDYVSFKKTKLENGEVTTLSTLEIYFLITN